MIEVAKTGDLLPGGMLHVKVGEKELCLCNVDGTYYAIQRRCGHMNAPLNMGTLDGYILTCAMHNVQFDVRTGEALSPTVPHYQPPLPGQTALIDNFGNWIEELMRHVTVCDIKTYKAVVEGDSIKVEL